VNIQTHSGKLAVNTDSDTIPFEKAVRQGKALVTEARNPMPAIVSLERFEFGGETFWSGLLEGGLTVCVETDELREIPAQRYTGRINRL
jgi:hypothetical protein